jgi:large subunit ribosomal protein L28
MAYRCFLCGKKKQIGRSSRHKRGVAGKQWLKRAQKTLKVFKPNLHVARLVKNEEKIKVKLCTKCLRQVKKSENGIRGWKLASKVIKKEPSFVPPVAGLRKGKEKPAPEKSPAPKSA